MLGSGGGRQGQLGRLLPGAKLMETWAGRARVAAVRWLPTDFFQSAEHESRAMLYSAGITRVAHDVLAHSAYTPKSVPAPCFLLGGVAQ